MVIFLKWLHSSSRNGQGADQATFPNPSISIAHEYYTLAVYIATTVLTSMGYEVVLQALEKAVFGEIRGRMPTKVCSRSPSTLIAMKR